MQCPRLRRLRWIALAVVLAPPVLWLVVLTVTPTEWVRTRLVRRLSETSGRSISMGRIWIGVLGGVHLTDLVIGAPGSGSDPWLKITSARINVSPVQLAMWQVEPTEIVVEGMKLRVLRRKDGTLELADLLRPGSEAATPGKEQECPGAPTGLEIRLRDAAVTWVDEPSRTKLELTGVSGLAHWEGRKATVSELKGTLNGGPFELSATLERAEGGPAFEGNFRAHGVAMHGATSLLSYIVPMLSGLSDAADVDGRMDLNFYVKGRGAHRRLLRRTLAGQGTVRLDPVTLDGSRVLRALDGTLDLPKDERVASINADFTIQGGRIGTEKMVVDVAKVPIVFSGWTDFDRKLDYRVRADELMKRLPGKAREILADLSIDLKDSIVLRVKGSLDGMKVTVNGGSLDSLIGQGDPPRGATDEQKLREMGRRVLDRYLR